MNDEQQGQQPGQASPTEPQNVPQATKETFHGVPDQQQQPIVADLDPSYKSPGENNIGRLAAYSGAVILVIGLIGGGIFAVANSWGVGDSSYNQVANSDENSEVEELPLADGDASESTLPTNELPSDDPAYSGGDPNLTPTVDTVEVPEDTSIEIESMSYKNGVLYVQASLPKKIDGYCSLTYSYQSATSGGGGSTSEQLSNGDTCEFSYDLSDKDLDPNIVYDVQVSASGADGTIYESFPYPLQVN